MEDFNEGLESLVGLTIVKMFMVEDWYVNRIIRTVGNFYLLDNRGIARSFYVNVTNFMSGDMQEGAMCGLHMKGHKNLFGHKILAIKESSEDHENKAGHWSCFYTATITTTAGDFLIHAHDSADYDTGEEERFNMSGAVYALTGDGHEEDLIKHYLDITDLG